MALKIALLTGAYINAGDFLITERAKSLIKWRLPDAEIYSFKRNEPLDDELDAINSCDCVVFAGGPGWRKRMWPEQFPLVGDLSTIEPPLFAMGMGSYAPTPDTRFHKPTRETRSLLSRFAADGLRLGCRDYLSVRMLESWGCRDAVMTGCPAWYSLDRVGVLEPRTSQAGVRTLMISDPAILSNYNIAVELLRSLSNLLKPERIVFVRHRGEPARVGKRKAPSQLNALIGELGAETVDISGSVDGMSVYQECDLHVGFRLHAHLYCTSERIPSVLLEEDGRGWGAEEALGLPHLACPMLHSPFRRANNLFERKTGASILGIGGYRDSLVSTACDYVASELSDGFTRMRSAYSVQKETLSIMAKHIDGIASLER